MKIRKATLGDIDSLVMVRMNSKYDPPKNKQEATERIKKSFKSSEIYLVEEKKVLAYFVITHKRKISYLNYIEVIDTKKKRGISMKIMNFLEKLSRSNHSKKIQLAVYAKNIPAVRIYSKAGFYFVRFRRQNDFLMGQKLVMEKETK